MFDQRQLTDQVASKDHSDRGVVVATYNPIYLGGRSWIMASSRLAQGKIVRPYLLIHIPSHWFLRGGGLTMNPRLV
jgi:hypothetical protein